MFYNVKALDTTHSFMYIICILDRRRLLGNLAFAMYHSIQYAGASTLILNYPNINRTYANIIYFMCFKNVMLRNLNHIFMGIAEPY